jgi:hypothetical protein
MKFTMSWQIWAALLLAWTGVNAAADLKDNPYRVISVRNPFALRAVPLEKVIEQPQAPAAPTVEILLTGVATLLDGSPRAILEFFDPQTKKSDRPSPFREGDRYNEHIRIVSIDAALGLVRISKDGLEMTLDFEKNGIKEGTTKPSASAPRPPVANVPPPVTPGRLIVNDRQTAAAPALTPQEVLARLHAERLLHQQQNPSAANIFPPPPVGRTP